MNLEELVRAALAEEAKAEPDEVGAYERFLGWRRRHALATAASTGLAVALVLALAVGGALVVRGGDATAPVQPAATTAVTPTSEPPQGPVETTRPAPPPVPVSAAGVVRRKRQGRVSGQAREGPRRPEGTVVLDLVGTAVLRAPARRPRLPRR